jgi:hypothetical protein
MFSLYIMAIALEKDITFHPGFSGGFRLINSSTRCPQDGSIGSRMLHPTRHDTSNQLCRKQHGLEKPKIILHGKNQ